MPVAAPRVVCLRTDAPQTVANPNRFGMLGAILRSNAVAPAPSHELSVAEEALRLLPILECITSHTTDARTTLALALCSRNCLNGVMYALNSKHFALIMDHYQGRWEWKVGINSSIKRYSCPNIALEQAYLNVPFVRIESSLLPQPFSYFPNKVPERDQWISLGKCGNVQKLYLISLSIDKFDEAWLGGNQFTRLKEIRLESVNECPNWERKITDENHVTWEVIQSLVVPQIFFKLFFGSGKLQNIELVSLYITEPSIMELENHLKNNVFKKVNTLLLEDLIIPDHLIDRTDDLMMTLIKANPHRFSLTLCIQRRTYGATLFRRFAESQLKIAHVHLMINYAEACDLLFEHITQLQPQCDNMTITFYHSYNRFRANNAINKAKQLEMKKWNKVTEINIGKRFYPYVDELHVGTQEQEYENHTYNTLLANLHLLPKLRKFGMKDRVLHNLTTNLSEAMNRWKLEELTLSLSRKGPNGVFNMTKYNELYAAIPSTVSSLNLYFCPINAESLEALSNRQPPLKHLTHYFHENMNQLAYEVRAALPKCSIERRRWLSPITTKINLISEYLCYLN